MKRISALCLVGLAMALVGCDGSKQPTNTMEGVDQEALQSYEEMVAADEAAMSEDPGDSEQ